MYSKPHFREYVYLHAEVNSVFAVKSQTDYVKDLIYDNYRIRFRICQKREFKCIICRITFALDVKPGELTRIVEDVDKHGK